MGATAWHAATADQVLDLLSVTAHDGLSAEEVRERLVKYGPNELVESQTRSWVSILLEQFTNVMVIVLIVAALVSALTGEITDAIVIGIILVLNAVLGF